MKTQKKRIIPYEFILEELDSLSPYTKPMFGAYGVYIESKIVFILRDRPVSPQDNGVWLATIGEHHKSLKKDFPSMRSIQIFGPGETAWQVLPADSGDFEEAALKACQLVLKDDLRIGKIPKTKMKKKSNRRKKTTRSKVKTQPRRSR